MTQRNLIYHLSSEDGVTVPGEDVNLEGIRDAKPSKKYTTQQRNLALVGPSITVRSVRSIYT